MDQVHSTFQAAPQLLGKVLAYFSVDGTARAHRRRVLPDGSIDLIFNLDPNGRGRHGSMVEPGAAVVGVLTKAMEVHRPASAPIFGAVFSPGAACGLLGVPARELRNTVIDLGDLFGSAGERLLDQLREATNGSTRAACVDAFLLQRGPRSPPPELTSAVSVIHGRGGALSIRELRRNLGVSERRLERWFAEHVGTSPKTFARMVRFGRVLERLEAADSPSSALAAELGYADQAHLIRDFREFSGTTPLRYRREQLSDSFNTTPSATR